MVVCDKPLAPLPALEARTGRKIAYFEGRFRGGGSIGIVGSQQVFEPFEVASGKVAESLYGKDEPPLVLLGFRPTEALKPHLNVKPATFLEPSETAAGSTVAARALVESMAAKGRIALARFRRQGAAQLVALLPQRREADPRDPAVTKLPCGFHLVCRP